MRYLSATAGLIVALTLLPIMPTNAEERSSEKHEASPGYSAKILDDREYAAEALATVKNDLQSGDIHRPGNSQTEEEDILRK